MKNVGFIYDDIFLLHEMPPGHPESKDRLISLVNYLAKDDIWNKLIHLKPRKAVKEEVLSVHTSSYFEKVIKFRGYYDADTFISGSTVEAALCAGGAVLEAVDGCMSGAIERAFCAVRPPGHHAEFNRAMGFCIFNNIAIGARHAQKKGCRKIFIIDFDVHHGNGTQHIFEDDDTVFYFSTHQYPHYPGTGSDAEKGRGPGKGFTYNIPLSYGSGDKEYFMAYQDILPGLVKKFSPDMIFVSAGYDLHGKDPLAGMRVSNEGIRNIVKSIFATADKTPCIFSLEGGYSLNALNESVLITLQEAISAP